MNAFCSGVRPFGVSLLICGWDNDRPFLFQCDPSVSQSLICKCSIFKCRVHISHGRLLQWVKIILMEKPSWKRGKDFALVIHLYLLYLIRYNEDLELEDAIHTTILTLKVSRYDHLYGILNVFQS